MISQQNIVGGTGEPEKAFRQFVSGNLLSFGPTRSWAVLVPADEASGPRGRRHGYDH
jgi:hypothetical protein